MRPFVHGPSRSFVREIPRAWQSVVVAGGEIGTDAVCGRVVVAGVVVGGGVAAWLVVVPAGSGVVCAGTTVAGIAVLGVVGTPAVLPPPQPETTRARTSRNVEGQRTSPPNATGVNSPVVSATRTPAAAVADIVLPDQDGRDIRLGDLWQDKLAVLVWLRHYG